MQLFRTLRPHQWTKNALVFFPVFTAHAWNDPATLAKTLLAFIGFSAAASAGYIINDLLDIQADRNHPTKQHRPIAAGVVSATWAWSLIGIALGVAGTAALLCQSIGFALTLGLYLSFSIIYSAAVKRLRFADVAFLAGLYVLRVVAGGEATFIPISIWLILFSSCLFFSLGCLKRFIELRSHDRPAADRLPRRGYRDQDQDAVARLGTTTGGFSLLVMGVYLFSDQAAQQYPTPWLLAPTVIILAIWLHRIWDRAGRGDVHDDPLIFALRDPFSWIAVIAAVTNVILAALIR